VAQLPDVKLPDVQLRAAGCIALAEEDVAVGFVIVRRRGDLLLRDQVLDHRAAELAELLELAGAV
jgi:hypothetical protein